ncbi:hypothetical protein PLESTB_000483900 [Pleodorina starrii]|uniref:EF-hand domain-containing protein n=1 Tax=Pleodorina starrii TaxID=330485 RepID=A0A9W6BFS5_9CHLO|nr:hypothetical protein PLESTB_000483900 [Pleodorina starrii]GLC63624.1 hypothetical protein PLESTF_000056800 [Pleodorina starrii]
MEIYERLDVERKGFITQQQLHAALNEAFGKQIRAETVRTLAARMDITSRHGLKVHYNDFMEYMAQKLLSVESYEDLLRSEQGPLMQEVGYKIYELLERFKRKQMLKDAMAGGDGIQRLLHLTTVPMAHRNRRRGQTGDDMLQNEPGAKGAKAGGAGPPSTRGRSRSGVAGADGGTTSRSIGDASFASRGSLVSRLSGSGADHPQPSAPPAAAAGGPRAANARSSVSGRPPPQRGRPSRNSAPAAARAELALASLLSRAEGLELPDHGPLPLPEDRGSSQRWRKSTSHQLVEELQQQQQQQQQHLQQQLLQQQQISVALPATDAAQQAPASLTAGAAPDHHHQHQHHPQQQQQWQHVSEAGGLTTHVAGGPLTLTVIRPLSSTPLAHNGSALSTHIASPSLPSSPPQPGLPTAGSAPAGGDGSGFWPPKRLLAPHASASAVPATAPNPLSRSSLAATASTSVPGRGGGGSAGRTSSASPLSQVGLAVEGAAQPPPPPLPLAASVPTSPLGAVARAEGWRSPALMAQVLEVERIDVHSLVMEDLRATMGLSTSTSTSTSLHTGRPQARQQQQPQQSQLSHTLSQSQQQQQQLSHSHSHSHVLSQSLPLQQQLSQVLLPPQHSQGALHATAPQASSLGLGLPSHSFPRQPSPVPEEGEGLDDGGQALDAAAAAGGDSGEGDMATVFRSQRIDSHTHTHTHASSPQHSLQQLPPAQTPRQLQAPRQSQPQPQAQLRRPHSQPQQLPQQQSQPQPLPAQQSQPMHHVGNAERRREGGPVGTWVTADPEGVLGQMLRSSLSSVGVGVGGGGGGGQPRNRPRFQAMASAPDALRLDVSGPIESDPVLAKLPDWVRKGIGLPPAPAVRPLEPELGAQSVALASEVSPPLTSPAATAPAAVTEGPPSGAEGSEAPPRDGAWAYNQQIGSCSNSSSISSTSSSGNGSGTGGGSGAPQEVNVGGAGGAWPGGQSAAAADAAGGTGHRMFLMRSSLRQSMTRFLPFGGDVGAVVAEEENEEGLTGDAPPQAAALSALDNDDGGEGAGGLDPPSDSFAAAVLSLPEGLRRRRGSQDDECAVTAAAAAVVRMDDPRVGLAADFVPSALSAGAPWTDSGQLGGHQHQHQHHHHPELLTPGLFAFRKHLSTWSGGGVDEDPTAGDGPAAAATAVAEWLGRDVEPTKESLAAWEASVLSRRSSVGHGSLHGAGHPEGQEQDEEEEEERGDGDEETEALFQQLVNMGGSGAAGRVILRASVTDPTEPPAPVVQRQQQQQQHDHHHHHQARPHAHWQQQEPHPEPQRGQQPQAGLRQGQGETGRRGVEMLADGGGATTAATPVTTQQQTAAEGEASSRDGNVPALAETHRGPSDASGGGGGPYGMRRPAAQSALLPAESSRPPFFPFGGGRPVSAALLPSAAAVVAAAEAAVASHASQDGSGLWSADYVGDGAAAPGRPAVRLNHAAMLRMQAQYGTELVASAGAALGLGGSSAAARDVASRELLQALASHGSGRVPPLPHSLSAPPQAAASPGGGGGAVAWADGPSHQSSPANAAAAAPRRSHSSSSSNVSAGAGKATLAPQRRISGNCSGTFLPHDAVGLGRQIVRQSSQCSSDGCSGAAVVGNGGGARGARPASARAAVPSGPNAAGGGVAAASTGGLARRPASARPPHNPVSHHAGRAQAAGGGAALQASRPLQAPTSPHTHTLHDPRGRPSPASAAPPAWGAAVNRRPPGRSASALAPTSHLPLTFSIGRVRQLDAAEVTSCFTALVRPNGSSGDGAGGPAARNATTRPAAQPLSPGSPASPPGPGLGPLAAGGRLRSAVGVSGGPAGAGAGGSGGGSSVGQGSGGALSSASSVGGRAPVGAAVEGSSVGVGEERRRRGLEVMGTGALAGRVARKSSAGGLAAGAGVGEAAAASGARLSGVAGRAR